MSAKRPASDEATTRISRDDLVLGGVVFAALSLLGQHTWGTVDAIQRFAVTRALVTHGSPITPEFGPVRYGPLQSVLMIPTYLLGKLIGALVGSNPQQVGYRVTAFLFTPLIVTAICVLYRRLAMAADSSPRASQIGVISLLLSTLLLPYTRLLFSEPLNGLLVLLSASGLLDAARAGRSSGRLIAVSSALLFLNGAVFGPLALAQVCAGAAILWRSAGRRAGIRAFVEGTIALAAAMGLWLGWNVARYGRPFRFGYDGHGFETPLATGLVGLLFSIGRGLLVYSAPTCLALCLVPFLWVRPRESGLSIVLAFYSSAFFAYLCLYATWGSFEGGWCWGPRFLLPFVPVLHLAIPPTMDLSSGWSRRARIALLIPFLLGGIVSAVEDLGTWKDWEKETFGSGEVDYRRSVFEPRYAALLHTVQPGRLVARLPLFLVIAGAMSYGLLRQTPRGSLVAHEDR